MSGRITQMPELMLMIVQQLDPDQKELFDLCLVNHTFNHLFSPILYRRLSLSSDYITRLAYRLSANGIDLQHLRHTKEILIMGPIGVEGRKRTAILLNNLSRSALDHIFRNTPNLESFICYDHEIQPDCLTCLSGLAHLRKLIVKVGPCRGLEAESDDRPELRSKEAEKKFRIARTNHPIRVLSQISALEHVVRLELLDLCSDMFVWDTSLLEILARCRSLEKLCLSMAVTCLQERNATLTHEHDPYENPWTIWPKFWDSMSSDLPLELTQLHLGYGVLAPSLQQMRSITNMDSLQDLAFWNNDEAGDVEDLIMIPWDILDPETTPNLRIFTCDTLDEDVWDHLEVISNDRRPLALRFVTARFDIYPLYMVYDVFDLHPSLKTTRLYFPAPDAVDHEEPIETSPGWKNVEQLAMVLCSGTRDRTDSAFYISYLTKFIETMPNLTDLWLRTELYTLTSEQLLQLESIAGMLAKTSRSLTFIRIDDLGWRVERSGGEPRFIALEQKDVRAMSPELFHVRRYDAMFREESSMFLEY